MQSTDNQYIVTQCKDHNVGGDIILCYWMPTSTVRKEACWKAV
ncbi:hypothetical protein [Mucilaginibacter sp.]